MRVVKIKKLYRGLASIRDYLVKDALKRGDGMQILYREVTMTLEHDELKKMAMQVTKTKFNSKFNKGEQYELWDFVFTPDIIEE